jgi:signal transduction histidine kinase
VVIAVFVLLAVGTVLAGYVYFDQNRRTGEKLAADQLNAVADLKIRQVTSWREERMSDARFIMANREIAAELSGFVRNGASSRTAVPEWMLSMYHNQHYEAIAAVDTDGHPLVGVPSKTGVLDPSLPGYVRAAGMSRQIEFTNFHSPGGRHVHLDIVVPVFLRRGNTLTWIACVVLRIDPSTFLFTALQNWPLPAKTAECVLFQADRDSVVLLSPLRHLEAASLSVRFPLADTLLTVVKGARGFEGVTMGTDYRGHSVLSAVRQLPGSPWALEAKMDVAEIEAPAIERGWLIAGLVLGLILTAGTSVVTVWRKRELNHLRRELDDKENIRRLNRVYSLLSNVNEAIVRIRDRKVLFQETCRIAVVDGGFAMAWIGEADPERGIVRAVASNGRVNGYLDGIYISMKDVPEGQGPTGVALREGKHAVCNDILRDPIMAPWRDALRQRGYNSSASFPVVVKGAARYSLTLYADVAGFFDAEEIRLLDELALDLSYALEFLDIEQEKGDAIAQLRQVQKMESLGTLAGGIAHDFNNILGIILGHITYLDASKHKPAIVSGSVEAIIKATERGTSLVRQILTFARKTDVALASLNVNAAVEELAAMLQETFPKNVSIVLELGQNLPAVTMDHTQLHQALLNLCVNARDAIVHPSAPTSRKGKITIATSLATGSALRERFPEAGADAYIGVRVSDTGAGMDEHVRQRVFEPFFTTKETGRGTGLGLAVVYGVVQGHRGLIDVSSRVGSGTTFSLWFPCAPVTTKAAKAEEGGPPPVAGGKETLLFVEDEESLLSMMRLVLEDRGYSVITARDGMEAIRLYTEEKENIALVISDLGLPKLDGVAVTTTLRELKSDCRVVLATGYLDPEVRARLAAAGVTDYLAKPYGPVDMLRKIREVLDRP